MTLEEGWGGPQHRLSEEAKETMNSRQRNSTSPSPFQSKGKRGVTQEVRIMEWVPLKALCPGFFNRLQEAFGGVFSS